MESRKKYWLSRDLWGFGLASFFNDFSHEMATSILPMFVEQLVGPHNAPLALGIINGISNVISSVTKLGVGFISDRLSNVKPLLIVGYSMTPLFICLIGTAQYVWQIVAYRTCAWIGRGLREPPRDAWLTEVTNQKDIGKAFGFQRAFDTLGAIAGPLVAFIALHYISLRSIFFISFIPGIFSVLSIIFIVGKYVKRASVPGHVSVFSQWRSLPKEFVYFVTIRFLFGIGNFNITLIILRAQELFSQVSSSSFVASSWAIGLYIIFNVIRFCGEYSTGFLSDYVNRKYLLALLGFGLFALVCLGLLYQPHTVFAWSVLFIMAGITTATVTVVEKAYAADLLPDYLRGTGYGVLQATKGFGELFSGLLIGTLWTFGSATIAFSCAAAISFISMLLLLVNKKSY